MNIERFKNLKIERLDVRVITNRRKIKALRKKPTTENGQLTTDNQERKSIKPNGLNGRYFCNDIRRDQQHQQTN